MSNPQVTNPNVTGRTQDYYAGMTQGRIDERERIIKRLEGYLEITQLPGDDGIEINQEWDAGFNSALALIKEEANG